MGTRRRIVAELAAQTPSAAAAKDPNTLTKNGDVACKANRPGAPDLTRNGRWTHPQSTGDEALRVADRKQRIDGETIGLVEVSVAVCHGAKPYAINMRKCCTSNLSQPWGLTFDISGLPKAGPLDGMVSHLLRLH